MPKEGMQTAVLHEQTNATKANANRRAAKKTRYAHMSARVGAAAHWNFGTRLPWLGQGPCAPIYQPAAAAGQQPAQLASSPALLLRGEAGSIAPRTPSLSHGMSCPKDFRLENVVVRVWEPRPWLSMRHCKGVTSLQRHRSASTRLAWHYYYCKLQTTDVQAIVEGQPQVWRDIQKHRLPSSQAHVAATKNAFEVMFFGGSPLPHRSSNV
eukprot:6172461-Amphidinium_carterae.1